VQAGELGAATARQAVELSASIRSQGWDKAVATAMGQAAGVGQLATAGQTAGLAGASALSSAGYQEQQNQQAQLTAMLQQWQEARDYPLQQLAIREGAVTSTPYGGTTASTQPLNKPNPVTSAIGGALSGAAAGTAISPGYGTAIGALVGAAGGYLGSR
jgi:hypothetical protein